MKNSKGSEKGGRVTEFDAVELEKRLTNLKDTQDSIQAMSAWCLQNRSHHKKIVASWLIVLKQGMANGRTSIHPTGFVNFRLFHIISLVFVHFVVVAFAGIRLKYQIILSWF